MPLCLEKQEQKFWCGLRASCLLILLSGSSKKLDTREGGSKTHQLSHFQMFHSAGNFLDGLPTGINEESSLNTKDSYFCLEEIKEWLVLWVEY